MRKALIAIAVATALFAVGAFAASFTVQSEDIASGSNEVTACATNVDVNLTTAYSTTANDWTVTGGVVTFYSNASGTTTIACENHDVTVVLENVAGDTNIAEDTTPVTGSSATMEFTSAPAAATVGRASVLVDGFQLFVDPTP